MSQELAELLVRGVPGTEWVRFGWMWGNCQPSWRVHTMYNGLVKRLAWTVFGVGPYLKP
jgi:hypothetical protein